MVGDIYPCFQWLNQSELCLWTPAPGCDVWIRVVLRTFVPVPGYDVWIRVGFDPIYSVGIKVVLWTPVPIYSVWFRDIFRTTVPIYIVWFREVFQETCPYLLCLIQGCFSGDMSLFVVSESELFFRRHVLICCVWIGVFFFKHQSLFVVSESELFLRTPVLICSVWIRVVFEDTSLYLKCLIQSCFSGDLSESRFFRHLSSFVLSDSYRQHGFWHHFLWNA